MLLSLTRDDGPQVRRRRFPRARFPRARLRKRAMPPARAAAPSLPPCSDCGAKSDFDLDPELGKATCRCGMVMPYRPAPARQAAKKSPTRIQKWYAEMSRRLGGLPELTRAGAEAYSNATCASRSRSCSSPYVCRRSRPCMTRAGCATT